MEVSDAVDQQLPSAVVASIVISFYNLVVGDPTALTLLTDFVLYVVAIFVGLVSVDILWNTLFSENDA